MAISFNHTIVNSRDKQASAAFLAGILGLPEPARWGPFAVVRTDNDANIDFMDTDEKITPQHYAFLVSEPEFDHIFATDGCPTGAIPVSRRSGKLTGTMAAAVSTLRIRTATSWRLSHARMGAVAGTLSCPSVPQRRTRYRRWVTPPSPSRTLIRSSSRCWTLRCSNNRRPPPNSTGIRWISNSSRSPAPREHCAMPAPWTITFLSPAACYAFRTAASRSLTYCATGHLAGPLTTLPWTSCRRRLGGSRPASSQRPPPKSTPSAPANRSWSRCP